VNLKGVLLNKNRLVVMSLQIDCNCESDAAVRPFTGH